MINDELFEFPKMLLVYGGAALAVFLWLSASIVNRKLLLKRTAFDIPILIFFGSQILSTIFSINPHTSLFGYYSRFNGGLLSTISYIILYYAWCFSVTKKDLKGLFLSLFTGVFLSSLYAFPEHFGHSPSCLLFTGNFNVDCWVQDVATRVFGTFGQPNWLAAYIALLAPLLLAFIYYEAVKERHQRSTGLILYLVTTWLLSTCVLLFTNSRSGIAGAGVGLIIFTILSAFVISRKSARSKMTLRLPIQYIGSCFIAFAFSIAIFGSPFTPRISTLISKGASNIAVTPKPAGGSQLEMGGSESGDIRKVVWKGAIAVWKRYPILGSGVETFAFSYYKDRPLEHNVLSEWDFLYNKAHNEFLNFLSTTGIVGFSAYILLLLCIILVPLYWAFSAKKDLLHSDRIFLCAIPAGLIALSISNFFGFSTVVVSYLLFIFAAIAVTIVQKDDRLVLSREELTANQWTGIGIAGFVLLIILWQIFHLWNTDITYARGKAALAGNDLQTGLQLLGSATNALTNEPTYRDEYSVAAAQAAYTLSVNGEATAAATFSQLALQQSQETIAQNPVSVSFRKSNIRVLLYLAQLDPSYYTAAIQAVKDAQRLFPTDPKLTFQLATIAQALGKTDEYIQYLKETIALKPNDERSRVLLGQYFESMKDTGKAKEQYEYVLQFINPNNQSLKDRLASFSAGMKRP